MLFSAVIGPILGATAVYISVQCRKVPLSRATIRALFFLGFVLFAPSSARLPFGFLEILGNGKAGNQLTFGGLGLIGNHSFELTAVKTAGCLDGVAVGAFCGLITPFMMLGTPFFGGAPPRGNRVLPAMPSESAASPAAAFCLVFQLRIARWPPPSLFWTSLLMPRRFVDAFVYGYGGRGVGFAPEHGMCIRIAKCCLKSGFQTAFMGGIVYNICKNLLR